MAPYNNQSSYNNRNSYNSRNSYQNRNRTFRVTVLQRLRYRRLTFSAFDLSAIGCMASNEYQRQTGRTPFKIKQREEAGNFRVAAYPEPFFSSLDRMTDLFLAFSEDERKEHMKEAMQAEIGPLKYLEETAPKDAIPEPAPPRQRKRRKRRITTESEDRGSQLAYTTRKRDEASDQPE